MLSGSLGQALFLYLPPKEVQVEVLMQIPDEPHVPVAADPVQRPLTAATETAVVTLASGKKVRR